MFHQPPQDHQNLHGKRATFVCKYKEHYEALNKSSVRPLIYVYRYIFLYVFFFF